jgi:redox-sensing transcriptional repressor
MPLSTIERLSLYYRGLAESRVARCISSEELAQLTGFSAALIRRDLSYFGQFGVPGKGYDVAALKEKILQILGIDRKWRVALIGMGNLGSALANYRGFKEQGFEVIAIFDNDRRKIGNKRAGVAVYSIDKLEEVARAKRIEMAIITVSSQAAQEVIERVIRAGIRAILNFAPVKVKIPPRVSLINIDMSVELERLSFLAARIK